MTEFVSLPEDLTPENFREFLATLPEDFNFAQDVTDYRNLEAGETTDIPWGCRCPIATFLTVKHPLDHGDRWIAAPLGIEHQYFVELGPQGRPIWGTKESVNLMQSDWLVEFMRKIDEAIGFSNDDEDQSWREKATAELALHVLDQVLFRRTEV